MANKRQPPKEIQERFDRAKREDEILSTGSEQAYLLIDKASKIFVKSKMQSGIHEKYAIEMLMGGLATVMADVLAHSYNKKYLSSLEQEVIKVCSRVHELATAIVLDRNKAAGVDDDKKIILPDGG